MSPAPTQHPEPEAEDDVNSQRRPLSWLRNRVGDYQKNPTQLQADAHLMAEKFLDQKLPPQLVRVYLGYCWMPLRGALLRTRTAILAHDASANMAMRVDNAGLGSWRRLCRELLFLGVDISHAHAQFVAGRRGRRTDGGGSEPQPDEEESMSFRDIWLWIRSFCAALGRFYATKMNAVQRTVVQQALFFIFVLAVLRRRFRQLRARGAATGALGLSALVSEIAKQNVARVEFVAGGNQVRAQFKPSSALKDKDPSMWSKKLAGLQTTTTLVPGSSAAFYQLVQKNVGEFGVAAAPKTRLLKFIFVDIGAPFLLLFFWYRLARSLLNQNEECAYSPNGPQKTRERLRLGRDVILSPAILTELKELVDLVNHPERYRRLRLKPFRGALLSGPAGTGKTMVAKSVAYETKAKFVAACGSELIEVYVGRGAQRVRSIFKNAREKAKTGGRKCVLFFDEIDGVGKRTEGKSGGSGGGFLRDAFSASNSEASQTVNQLLAELDGFGSGAVEDGIIVLAATNRYEALDSALLRPGRFDRQIFLQLPDEFARAAILRRRLRGKKLILEEARVDPATGRTLESSRKNHVLEDLCGDRLMRDFSGADVAHVATEAVYIALRDPVVNRDRLQSLQAALLGGSTRSGGSSSGGSSSGGFVSGVGGGSFAAAEPAFGGAGIPIRGEGSDHDSRTRREDHFTLDWGGSKLVLGQSKDKALTTISLRSDIGSDAGGSRRGSDGMLSANDDAMLTPRGVDGLTPMSSRAPVTPNMPRTTDVPGFHLNPFPAQAPPLEDEEQMDVSEPESESELEDSSDEEPEGETSFERTMSWARKKWERLSRGARGPVGGRSAKPPRDVVVVRYEHLLQAVLRTKAQVMLRLKSHR